MFKILKKNSLLTLTVVILTLVLIAGVVLALTPVSAAPDNYVWIDRNKNGVNDYGDYNATTISEAIANAVDWDVIYVEPGTYNEYVWIEGLQGVKIIGRDRETTIISGMGLSGSQAALFYIKKCSHVTVESLTFAHHRAGWGWGIQTEESSYIVIKDCTFTDNYNGVNFYRGTNYSFVTKCMLTKNDGNAISIYGSDVGCKGNVISWNKIIDNAYAEVDGYRVPAICIFSKADNNLIEHNLIKQVGNHVGKGRGICLWGATYGGADSPEHGNIIAGNKISGFDIGIAIIGCNPKTGTLNLVSDTRIYCNSIEKNRYGVWIIGFDENGEPGSCRFNNIRGNEEWGVLNQPYNDSVYPSYDAENNWWGHPSGPSGVGPGRGDAVSDNVDYEPWLRHPVPWMP